MTPISSRRRALYLLLAAAIVVIGAPILIIYAEGYRPTNLLAWSFHETGGIYVDAGQSGVAVSVDGEPSDVTSFLSRGVLVQNLVEGTYAAEAAKVGYATATKSLQVYPSLVSEWHPLLVPSPVVLREIPEYLPAAATGTASKPVPLARNPERATVLALFAPATTTKAATAKAASSTPAADPDLAALLIASGDRSIAENPTLRRSGDLAAWAASGAVHLAWLGDGDSAPQYLCAPSGCDDVESFAVPGAARAVEFYPGRDDAFLVLTSRGLYAAEADGRGGREILPVFSGNGADFRLSGGSVYVEQGSKLWEVSLR